MEGGACSRSDDPALVVARVIDRARDALSAGHRDGQRTFGDFELPFQRYAAEVVAGLAARFARLDLKFDEDVLLEAVARCALSDLYLARALEQGSAAAWTCFEGRFVGRLIGLLTGRGARGVDPEAIATALLADLALPPPRGNARTLAGTYDGSGSLWGWLAAAAVRRLSRTREQSETGPSAVREAPAEAAPWHALVERETADELERALRETWTQLDADERLVICWRHGQGLSQRQIASLLGVAEYQVSRTRSSALSKLRGAVARTVQLPPGGAASLWGRLELVVGLHLASSTTRGALPSDATGAASNE